MLAIPNCWKRKCKHYIGPRWTGEGESSEKNVCEVFQDGIPDEIAYGDNLHLAPLDGQGNTIVFEEKGS